MPRGFPGSGGSCQATGCREPVGLKGAKGYCRPHYGRWRRYGDPLAGGPMHQMVHPAHCTVDGCVLPYKASGFCGNHWYLWKKHGDPTIKKTPWDTREKINPLDCIEKTDTHWYWTGYKDRKGYGWLSGRPAHVIIWELLVGPVPAGLQLDHVCRVHPCVRPHPEHLEPVTQQENINRGIGLSVVNRAKTHCPRDHEYTSENTYIDPSGGRRCRKCQKITNSAWLKRRAARGYADRITLKQGQNQLLLEWSHP